jgi:hypothetical protein
MAFEQTYPLFAFGPRADLSVAYGRFTVSNSGATLTASADTIPGMTMTGAAGTYVLNHPKCRFRNLFLDLELPVIATVANARQCVQHVPVAGTDDAPAGVLNFNTVENDTATAVATPVDGSVIRVFGLLGF